ncbi:hypothetical protein IZY60_00010 [Lutibacter sp. B2]|nr:hypothetical protein [Lutibacter sp. B2]
MKNKIVIWIVILFVNLNMIGCTNVKTNMIENIIPPNNDVISIEGKWEIKDYKVWNEEVNSQEMKKNIGQRAIFDNHWAVIGDEICKEPKYKIKKIDAYKYFLYTYKMNPIKLGIREDDIEVVSITSNEKLFYEIIRVSQNQLIVFIKDTFYYLYKTGNEIEGKNEQEFIDQVIVEDEKVKKEDSLLRSGVLIGLRSDIENRNVDEMFSYRTIWISSKNRQIHKVLKASNLIVPRKSGFWMIGTKREKQDGFIQDQLFAKSMKQDLIQETENQEKTYGKLNYRNKILFAGNDYIGVEYSENNQETIKSLEKLRVVPIDNIKDDRGVKISDIYGKEAKAAFISSAKAKMRNIGEHEYDKLEKVTREESFSMVRRTGHWMVKGRLNYKKPQIRGDYVDFDINIFPAGQIIHYDKLYISWNDVKSKVPEALDAFTSPNKELVVIVSHDQIYVYTIKDFKLSNKPIQMIPIKKGETVVMAEWATSSYVKKWTEILTDMSTQVY